MKSNREAPFTRKQGKSAGISLSWRKELNTDNPIEASTSGGAVVEPVQQSSSEQELNTVSICEPLDEINLEEEFDDNLAWDHIGDLQSPQGGHRVGSRWIMLGAPTVFDEKVKLKFEEVEEL